MELKILLVGVLPILLAIDCASSAWTFGANVSDGKICGITPYQLETREHLKILASQIKQTEESGCPPEIRSAVERLSLLVDDNGDPCSQAKADQLREYHYEFIEHSADKKSNKVVLPKVMQEFYFAFGLNLSKLCRRQMIDVLGHEVDRILQSKHSRNMNELTTGSGLVTKIIPYQDGDDDLVVPESLIRLRQAQSSVNDRQMEKLVIKINTKTPVNQLKSVCRTILRPIYEKLVLPIVSLAEVGFNTETNIITYQSEYERMVVNRKVMQWYRIVFLCEALKYIDLVEVVDATTEADEEAKTSVEVLSQEKASELRGRLPELFYDEQQDDERPIQYELKRSKLHVPNQIVERDKKYFMKTVDKLRKSQKPNRFNIKFVGKISSALKDKLRRSSIRLALNLGHYTPKGLQITNGKQLVDFIENYVQDPHEIWSFKARDAKEALRPYVFTSIVLGIIMVIVGIVGGVITAFVLAGTSG